jgi:hypothetical protein
LKRRSITQDRLDPDAAAVHLHNLLRDREPETGSALRLGVGTIDLVELLKDACLIIWGNAGAGIGDTDVEVTFTAFAVTRTSPASVNLMALPTILRST